MAENIYSAENHLLSLNSVKIERIHRHIEVCDESSYTVRTSITINNTGNTDVTIIPIESFPKERLIKFRVYDQNGSSLTSIPSEYNDELLTRMIFLKSFQTLISNENRLYIPILCDLFFGRDIQDEKQIQALSASIPLSGKLARRILKIMWKDDLSVSDLADSKIDEYISEYEIPQETDELNISQVIGKEVIDWLKILELRFTQLVQLDTPIKPSSLVTITCENTHFANPRLPFLRQIMEHNISVSTYLPIFERNYSLHYEIIPPEGMKLLYKSLIRNDGKKIWSGEDIYFNEDIFCLLQEIDSKSEACKNLLNAAGIEKGEKKKVKDSKEPRVPDPRACSREKLAVIYIRKSFATNLVSDKKDHNFRLRFGLANKSLIIFHIALLVYVSFVFLVTIFFASGYLRLVQDWNAVGGLILTGFAQVIAAIVDLSSRSRSEKAVAWKIPIISLVFLFALMICYFILPSPIPPVT